MSRTLGWRALVAVFLRAFLIQGSWNYRTMQGSGFAFSLVPALRELHGDDVKGYEEALRRHLEHFNAHPYLAHLALGAVLRLEAEGEGAEGIRRFKGAIRGPLGGIGDALVWASWLPAVSLTALSLIWLGFSGWWVILGFLALYNSGHLSLRLWSFRAGWAGGRAVGRLLGAAALGGWTERVRSVAGLALGLFIGVILAGEGGLGSAGASWTALAAAAFVVGAVVGQRLWRPATAAVVAAVALLATWGWIA